jgi:hypothetical protein
MWKKRGGVEGKAVVATIWPVGRETNGPTLLCLSMPEQGVRMNTELIA